MIDTDQGRHLAHARHAFTIAPDLTQHIASMRGMHVRSNQPNVQTTKEPPVPLNVNAVDDLDDLYMTLVYWCGVFSKHLRVGSPAPLANARRLPDGTVVGFPHDVTPEIARAAVTRLTRLPLIRIDELARTARGDLAEFDLDAVRIIGLRTRWAVEDGPTYSQVPCPHHDHRVGIALYPVREFIRDHPQHRLIVCDHGHYFTEDEFAEATRAHVEDVQERRRQGRKDQADRERGAKTLAHLMTRYGGA